MEFKNPFLSWLFAAIPEEEVDAPSQGQEDMAAAEDAPEAEAVSAPEPAPPQHELRMPSDHALHQLWELRCHQAAWLPKPVLCLEGPAGDFGPLPDQTAQKELLRLQMLINSTANARIKLAKSSSAEDAGTNSGPAPPPALDAKAVAFVSADGMAAWLMVYPPVGSGEELTREILAQALEEKQVFFGLDNALLEKLPEMPDRYFQLFPVACGKPPIPGTDGRVIDLFPREHERKITIDENNRVDYMSVDFVHNVSKGATICRILPPTKAQPGQSVQGQEVTAKDGRAASAPKGRNTELSEDGGKLVASIDGHVEFNGRTFQVRPLLEIPGNVDYSTGNINFLGDVCIRGDVCSGFTVRAMGNITVDGVVEACSIEAGGNLVVGKGVQGDNQAVIRAGRCIFAKYLESSRIYVKETLQTDCLINCDVYCGGGVLVRSGRMTIIGGTVRAAHEVSAGVIGSRSECRTSVQLGGHPCEAFDYDVLTREIKDLEEDMARTERQPDSPHKVTRMSKMRMQLLVARQKLEQLNTENEQLMQEDEKPGVRRMVCDTVYPGTGLSINEVNYYFDRQVNPCTATLADGEIRLR